MALYSNLDTAVLIADAAKAADGRQVQFEAGDELDIVGGKVLIAGVPVTDDAAEYLLENMQVKRGFIRKVGPKMEAWDDVRNALRGMFAGKSLAMYVEDGAIRKVRAVTGKYSPNVYAETAEALALAVSDIADRKVTLSRSAFADGKLILQFANEAPHSLPHGEIWKTGHSVCIDPFGVVLEPYMERVVCSNGMVRAVPTGRYSLVHGSSADRLFYGKLGKVDGSIIAEMADGVRRMKEHNASVREFLAFRDILDSCDSAEAKRELERAPGGEDGGFGTSRLIEAYGEDLVNMSDRWLSTADSGVNAFDVLNSATRIASRPAEFNLGPDVVLRAQRLAAKTMLASLDLQHVAPKPNLN